jgi:hypothetical protein
MFETKPWGKVLLSIFDVGEALFELRPRRESEREDDFRE